MNRVSEMLRPDASAPHLLAAPRDRAPSGAFSAVLNHVLEEGKTIHFSGHARQRLEERSIALSPMQQRQLENAVESVREKGGRQALVALDNVAFIVSVPNSTVITAMSRNELDGAVFTNIDSAVLASAADASSKNTFSDYTLL